MLSSSKRVELDHILSWLCDKSRTCIVGCTENFIMSNNSRYHSTALPIRRRWLKALLGSQLEVSISISVSLPVIVLVVPKIKSVAETESSFKWIGCVVINESKKSATEGHRTLQNQYGWHQPKTKVEQSKFLMDLNRMDHKSNSGYNRYLNHCCYRNRSNRRGTYQH